MKDKRSHTRTDYGIVCECVAVAAGVHGQGVGRVAPGHRGQALLPPVRHGVAASIPVAQAAARLSHCLHLRHRFRPHRKRSGQVI